MDHLPCYGFDHRSSCPGSRGPETDAAGNSTVIRYRFSTNIQDIYAHLGVMPGTSVPFPVVTGPALDPNLNLFVGDDPTNGAQVIQGRVWRVAPPI